MDNATVVNALDVIGVQLRTYESLFVALICELDKEAVSRVYAKAYEYAPNEAAKKEVGAFIATIIDKHHRQ